MSTPPVPDVAVPVSASAPVRVLHLIPGVGAGGGAERSLVEMAPGLLAAGIDLHVAYFVERPTSALHELHAAGVPVTRVGAPGWARRVLGVRRLLADLQPDVLHTSLFEADLVGRVAAAGMPTTVLGSLVHTKHDPLARRDPLYSGWRFAVVRAVEGFTARHLMDHAVANSEAARWATVRGLRIDPTQITVVPRGRSVPTHEDRGAVRRRVREDLGVPAGAVLLLNVGRHEFQKDHRTLLEAVAEVVATQPDVRLVVAGREGQVTSELHRLIAVLGLAEHVMLLGPRDDVPELLVAADLFVFPSLLEGLPGAVIEAMAAEVPVVATSIPAIWELVGPNEATLVDTEDPRALAAAIAELISDPSRGREQARAAHVRYGERFTLDRAVADTAALYRSLAPDGATCAT